ncbi:MAG: hypothetical protein IJL54_07100 [Prevotella sp.]|nr:hypothetical protein [Prevotella sp.]
MKKFIILYFASFIATATMAQNDSVKKVNVYVFTPHLLIDNKADTIKFAAMKETVKRKVNKCSKTQVCEDPSKCEYFLSTRLIDYEQKYMSAAEMKSFEPTYLISFKMKLFLYYFPFENRNDSTKLSADNLIDFSELVEKSGKSAEGFQAAITNACEQHPNSFYINRLFERALYVPGQIIELGKDTKGKDVVYIDKGATDGISEKQWFNVYLKNDNHHEKEVIGTLELAKREAHRSQCKIRKNKEQIIAYLKQGKTLIVESRESSNILKKIKKGYDDVRPLVKTVTKGLTEIGETMSEGLKVLNTKRP